MAPRTKTLRKPGGAPSFPSRPRHASPCDPLVRLRAYSRAGYRERPEGDGRTPPPNGINIDAIVAGVRAYDEELRPVGDLEPDAEQADLKKMVSEIRMLIGGR